MSAPESSAATEPASSAIPLRHHRSFVAYWCARTATNGAYQMQAVAVGWQIYELTGRAFDLGLVGLVQFVPVVLLGLVVGPVADRYDRRVVVAICQIVKALAAAALAVGTWMGWLDRDAMLAILFVSGTARAFETPTMHALVPGIVPPELLQRAIAASSTATQTSIIAGPAIGGVMVLLGTGTVYLTCTVVFVVASILISTITMRSSPPSKVKITLEAVLAGFKYIRHNPVVLGAISLDLFAMLLGGVTALLPVYAKDILQTGPWGLGLLRSSPAIGALAISVWLAHHPLRRRVGHILTVAVVMFGLSAVVFACSSVLAISIAALAVYGASDAVSVVIRHSLVQTRTPNEMLGRVLAVNFMFTGTSGTLGEFRAGALAALFGAFTSVFVGGAAAVGVALLWMKLFPALYRTETIGTDQR